MVALIAACELAFWALLVLGLALRYVVKLPKVGAVVLAGVPVADLILLVAAVADVRSGVTIGPGHGLVPIYLGVTVAFGHRLIRWADARFAHRFAGGTPTPRPPRWGSGHAARQRVLWAHHLLAYAIAWGVVKLLTAVAPDPAQIAPIHTPMELWG